MRPTIHRRAETIRETPTGWLNKHTGRTHKTATAAFNAVQRRNKAITESNPKAVVVCVTKWETITDAGRVIAKAFSK